MRALPFLLLLAACAPKPVATPAPVEAPAPPPDPLAEKPAFGPDTRFTPPSPAEKVLQNGVRVWTIARPELPLVSLDLRVPGGSRLDPAGKEGAAALGARLMTQGAGKLDSTAFAATTERLGIVLTSDVTADDATIRLSCTKEVLPQALDLLADMVQRPAFTAADFKRERDLAVSSLKENLDDPSYVASRTAQSLFWGAGHPYGRPVDGTIAGYGKLSVADVKAWYGKAWVASGATMTVAGAVTADEVAGLLDPRFSGWKAGTRSVPQVPPAPGHTDQTVYLVDEPDSAQTGFYLVFPGVKVGAAETPPLRTGTIAFGGIFTSRLNALLREKKGYTYGAKANLVPLREGGTVVIRSRIRADVTAPALTDILGELDRIRQGVTDDERVKAQGAYKQDLVAAMETLDGVAVTFEEVLASGRPADTLASQLSAVAAVQTADIPAAMARWDQKQAVFVLVGDVGKIRPELEKAGYTKLRVVTPP